MTQWEKQRMLLELYNLVTEMCIEKSEQEG